MATSQGVGQHEHSDEDDALPHGELLLDNVQGAPVQAVQEDMPSTPEWPDDLEYARHKIGVYSTQLAPPGLGNFPDPSAGQGWQARGMVLLSVPTMQHCEYSAGTWDTYSGPSPAYAPPYEPPGMAWQAGEYPQ